MSLQDQLKELFILDKHVRGLRSRLDAAVRRRNAQKTRLDQFQRQTAELADQIKQHQVQANALEQQADDIDQRIARHRDQMNAVHSNKEYSALLVEVNTLKNDKAKIEDQALEQMTEVDTFKHRHVEIEQKLTQQKKLLQQAETEAAQAQEDVGEKLEQVTAQRTDAAGKVPDDVRTMFDRLADAYDGQALAEVEEQDRRRMEYHCGGCYISLPVEHVNSLMVKPDELVTCPNCHRLLYIDQQLKSAIRSQ